MIETVDQLVDAMDEQLSQGSSEAIGFHYEGERLEIESVQHVGNGSPIEITLKKASY